MLRVSLFRIMLAGQTGKRVVPPTVLTSDAEVSENASRVREPRLASSNQGWSEVGALDTAETGEQDTKGPGDGPRLQLEELFRTRRRELYLHAYGILRDSDAANDTLQDAFVRALCHLEKFSTRNDPHGWVRRIVTNLCLDGLRRRHTVGAVRDWRTVEPRAPMSLSPSHDYEARQLASKLERAAKELSPEHQRVLFMRVVDEMSYAEMARVSRCPVGTIMSRLFHARRGLRSMLCSG